MSRKILNALVIALLVIGTACGSGGGDSAVGSGIGGGFAPDQPDPGANSVATAEGGTGGGNLVVVEIAVTDTANVYGASFTLTYNPNIASFIEWSNGSLLEQGGHSPTYQVASGQAGELVVVATRQGDVSAVSANGTVTLIELTFRLNQAGETGLQFQFSALFDDSIDPLPMPGISWFGGSLIGT